jgi:ADP-heptose:LPS heptosyltransferase
VKILIFSHDGKLGDAVVNTAFVDGVLQLDPAAELQVLVSGTTAGFWALDRRIRKTWMFENPPLGEALRTSLALRRERFDYIVTWKERFRSEKTRLMLWLAKPSRGILYEEGRVPGTVSHAVRKCQESLRLIYGERAAAITPRYRLGLELEQPGAFAGQLPAQGEVILFNMFSAEKPKTINPDDGARVLVGLARLAPQAALCTSCVNATEAAARAAIGKAGVRCALINTEKDLQRLILLCARADLIVSTDTSLIHIASALDKPVLGIYLNDPEKAVQWAPLASRAEAVVSPRKDSVDGFSVEEVLQKAQQLRTPPRP